LPENKTEINQEN